MKRILTFLLLFLTIHASAQFTVTVFPADIMICHGGEATFTATVQDTSQGTYSYNWIHKGVLLTGIDTLVSSLHLTGIGDADTGAYLCIARDFGIPGKVATSDTFYLRMNAQLHIDTLYRFNQLACPRPEPCKGQMKVVVSGGNPPYTYDWGSGIAQPDGIGYSLCRGKHLLTVSDTLNAHCISREYTIEVLKLPPIAFRMDPPDTLYLSNPYLTVAFEDTSEALISTWNWDFDDKSNLVSKVNPCQHAYTKPGLYYVKMNYTDLNGCDSTITDTLTVKTIRLFIPNVITPGKGDDNSKLNIRAADNSGKKPVGENLDLAEIFLSNQLFIFNRQGQKVYEKTDYKSGDWDGGSLSEGVYYYVLKCHGAYADETYKGAITILR